ncbi:hypothetical protein [Pleurocapsa sp. FMAR1]|uniref:hypothetical protein n=1 Tax=Pleurocapsa sp. FMAR1 TaxID=3040204 RepID=UPI0029C96E6D|nr:hypothetical protein [Pleurocapsa sp. FMAR1]
MLRLNIINSSVPRLLFLTLFLIGFPIASIQAQSTTTPVESQSTENKAAEGNSLPSASIFSIEGGKKLMAEADKAIDAQNYALASQKLQRARQVYNQLSNFYLQLFNSTTGIDNAAAESQRKKALETGVARDNATYQLALVHRAQGNPELSIPLLIQVVTSQSPGIGLGKKAYDQLLEIGFVDTPLTISKPDSTPLQNPAPTPQSPQSPPDAAPQAPNPEAQPPSVDPTIPNP